LFGGRDHSEQDLPSVRRSHDELEREELARDGVLDPASDEVVGVVGVGEDDLGLPARWKVEEGEVAIALGLDPYLDSLSVLVDRATALVQAELEPSRSPLLEWFDQDCPRAFLCQPCPRERQNRSHRHDAPRHPSPHWPARMTRLRPGVRVPPATPRSILHRRAEEGFAHRRILDRTDLLAHQDLRPAREYVRGALGDPREDLS